MNKDTWLRHVAKIEVLIEEDGMYNTFGAVLEALNNIEHEESCCIDNFEETSHYKNIQHCKEIIEYVMSACDLDFVYGSAEARRVAAERFAHDIKQIGCADHDQSMEIIKG